MEALKSAVRSGDRDGLLRAVNDLGLEQVVVAMVTQPGPFLGGSVNGFFVDIDGRSTILDLFVVPEIRNNGIRTVVMSSAELAEMKTTAFSPAFAAMMAAHSREKGKLAESQVEANRSVLSGLSRD